MYYYWDPTYILVIIGMLICLGASAMVNSAMSRYSRVRNAGGITGAEAARRILNNEGLYNVQIECLNHSGGDHYDPRTNTVRLSHDNYNQPSVTAVGVAAHECGHAIQHAKGYVPLNFRSALVPVANIGSRLGLPLILLGVILGWSQVLIEIGIWAFALAVLFQLVTLPVEYNASSRALGLLETEGILESSEIGGAKKVLGAAALTYVASLVAAIVSMLNILRMIIMYRRNRW